MTEPSARVCRFQAGSEDAGQRLDRWLAARLRAVAGLPELSRTRIQQEIAQGHVRVGGAAARPSHRLEPGEAVEIALAPPAPLVAAPEPIPLDILYEDDDLIAVNKPAGLAVHPGAGLRSGTVANALAARYGNLSTLGGPERPGIVHRLDKDTSGILLVARNDDAHRRLARLFASRQVEKSYLALVHGLVEHDTGRIDLPIARDLRRRTRMTTRLPAAPQLAAASEGGPASRQAARAALTTWRVLLRLQAERSAFTLLQAGLHTGRTHQIRVHFAALHHPVVGDTRYGAPRRVLAGATEQPPLGRLWLHAARVRLAHPRTGEPLELRAPLAPKLAAWLTALARSLGSPPAEIDRVLRPFL